MNGDVGVEAPRARPLSAGIWTLFSWLRRTERSSSSESVSSVGSDRTVASFDFLAPLHYKQADTLVLPQDPLTETYKKRLHERNLRRQHDRDITLRRKYGLFREEGLGYDAFSLPSARRLQHDSVLRQDRDRRAASEIIQRRSAYVPGKRRAPLPPTVVSATLPRNYKRKRPAPKPPVRVSEENKENVENNKIVQMNSTSDAGTHSFLSKDLTPANKTERDSKLEIKEVKLRAEKSFLKQIFDNKKRNSAIDTSRIKLLPSISELDKQAAEIIEANKLLQTSRHNDGNYTDSGRRSDSTEETWKCTTCLRKYKPVVTCCIYCIIKENSNKTVKNVPSNASNIYTQTDVKDSQSSGTSGIDDKKKLREMLKEMKDSLPKRQKHNEKYPRKNRDDIVKPTETPTLRIGSTVDENIINSNNDSKAHKNELRPENLKNNAKEAFLMSQPSSSKESHLKLVNSKAALINEKAALINEKSDFESPSTNFNNSGHSCLNISKSKVMQSERESLKSFENHPSNSKPILGVGVVLVNNKMNDSPDLGNMNKPESSSPKYDKNIINELLDNKVHLNVNKEQNHPLNKMEINSKKDSSTNSKKEVQEIPAHIKDSKISARNTNQPIVLPNPGLDRSSPRTKDKIERIQLANVYPSNIVNIDQSEPDVTSNNSKNINLHTPLKISSLLNPLYCPKYKISNTNVSDCNFANILTTKVENKIDEPSVNQQKIITNIMASTSTNVQTPSASNPKLLNEALQKSEASSTVASKVKKIDNAPAVVKDPKRKIGENALSEGKATSIAQIIGHHDRRRNLINQLEQAIARGDEQLAAEAAAKLAKLKVACSVLSFSSQIVAEALPNTTEVLRNIPNEDNEIKRNTSQTSTSHDKANNNNADNQQELQNPTPRKEKNISQDAIASTSSQRPDEQISIEVWIEDKEAARGPIPLRISRKARIGELKAHVETTLGLEIRLQRWIVGRTLCTDDSAPLVSLAGPYLDAPFYLCLVESETNKNISPPIEDTHAQIKIQPSEINNAASSDVYTELMKLEQQALVPNAEEFECGVCMEQCAMGAGAVLRECIHAFCRECLADVIRHCDEPVVGCPAIECPGAIQEREIRAILTAEEYERWLARGLAAAESGTRNTFHCRTPDCKGWAFCEPEVRRFPCPVCKHTNCVPCQAVHEGETCEQYQRKLREAISVTEPNQTEEGTQALLKSLISRGEALECPECSAIITKKWGCDWVKCSACKTEICWVTKGRRWGPGGKGDTSGGCKCGVDGKRCHPSCGYCH